MQAEFGLVHFAQLTGFASFGEKDCGGAKQNGESYIQSSAVAGQYLLMLDAGERGFKEPSPFMQS